jgi:hypothetical protein
VLQGSNYVDRRYNMMAAKLSQVGYATSQLGKVRRPPHAPTTQYLQGGCHPQARGASHHCRRGAAPIGIC